MLNVTLHTDITVTQFRKGKEKYTYSTLESSSFMLLDWLQYVEVSLFETSPSLIAIVGSV